MAKDDRDSKSPTGITYRRRIGPDGKSYNFNVPPDVKKSAPVVKPKPKPKAKASPVEPKVEAPADPKRGQEQRFRPAPGAEETAPVKVEPKMSAQQEYDALRKAPKTYERDYENRKKYERQPDQKWYNFFGEEQGGAKKRAFENSPNRYPPAEMNNGGKVRGDGISRVKTKGRCL